MRAATRGSFGKGFLGVLQLKVGYSTLCLLGEPFKRIEGYLASTPEYLCEILNDGFHLLDSQRIRVLNRVRDSHHLEYVMHLPFAGLNYAASNPFLRRAAQKMVLRALDQAVKLECSHVLIHSGQADPISSVFNPESAWRYTDEFLETVGKVATERGVQPLIENNFSPSYTLNSAEDMARFFGLGCSRYYKVALDIGHAFLTGDLNEFVERFRGSILELHIHDNRGQSDEHLALDEGMIPWRQTLERLLVNGFDGMAIVENKDWNSNTKSCERLKSFLHGT